MSCREMGIIILAFFLLVGYASASLTGTVVVPEKMSSPSISISNTVIDQGQSILFTASFIGGTSPFTYNYLVINSVTGEIVANMLVSNSYNGNAFLWTPQYPLAGNTIEANVVITDSTLNSLASSYTATANINTAPSITITPSESVLQSGNSLTYTINEMYGTGPFDVEIFSISENQQYGPNAIVELQGGNTITFTASAPSTRQLVYNAIATDKGTTFPYTFSSASNSIEVINNSVTTTVPQGTGPPAPPPVSPVTERLANGCLLITNVTIPNSFEVLLNGSAVTVTDSYISSNYTYVIANGRVYVLYEGANSTINGTQVRIKLLNTSSVNGQYRASFIACSSSPPTTSIPLVASKVYFTSLPVYTELTRGTAAPLQLGLYNPTASEEYVNISVDSGFKDVISFSTAGASLFPGEGLGIGILLSANPSLSLGSHVIPLRMRISGAGLSTVTQTAFITLAILNSSPGSPVILNQLSMVNYTGSNSTTAMGTIRIESPYNESITNASLETILPASLVHSASQVSTYGMPANVTMQGGSYVIIWHVPYMPRNATTYSYYRIGNPIQQLAPQIRDILIVPLSGPAKLNDVLDVYNISVPVFYSGATNYVYVHALYTAAVAGNVSMTLKASNGIRIGNSTRRISVVPNQHVDESFPIANPGNAGTMLLTLDIGANGATSEYTIPVVVQQRPVPLKSYTELLAAIAAAAAAIAVIWRARAGIRKAAQRESSSRELEGMKRQIGDSGK
ncbi:MAG: hypothetical protein KGI06_05490 [Candidatus Micrarchaeota archaeon]|nr:hypothetical protein [Candidatus Micrarchaeota archaeon]